MLSNQVSVETNTICRITRSGIKIVFNDDQKSLHIEDPIGNAWDGNIKVKAPKSIVMDSPQITLNAHKNLSLNVSEYFYSNVGKLTQLHTGTLHQFVSGNMSTYSNNSLTHSDTSMKIQSKELSSVGSESLLLHSDKNAIINSKGTAFFHGKDSISHTNSPLNVAMQKAVQIGNAVVEFRPTNTYIGEFGFDWLRVKDTPTGSSDEGLYYHKTPPASFTEDILYAVNIEGEGKFTGNIKNEKITTFYENIDVIDEEQKYFVPYLNIYPSTAKGNPSPPSTETLKLLIRVKGTEPARVQIEFNHLKSHTQIGADENSFKDTPFQITGQDGFGRRSEKRNSVFYCNQVLERINGRRVYQFIHLSEC